MIENVPSVIDFDKREFGAWYRLHEAVEARDDVWVGLQLDPLGQVLIIVDLLNNKLSPKVLMVDDEWFVVYNVTHLFKIKHIHTVSYRFN